MGLFSKEKKIGVVIKHVDGLNVFETNEDLQVYILPKTNEITFKSVTNKKKPVIHLSLDKLKYADKATDKEIQEKDKSVMGRAAVGTLLLGPLGTVLGGMSGIGSKKKIKDRIIVTIGYESEEQEKEILLIESSYSLGLVDIFYTELIKYTQSNAIEFNGGHVQL